MKQHNLIFVVDDTFKNKIFEDFFEKFTASIQWGYENLNHSNVIVITELDMIFLDSSGIVNIISKSNDSYPIGYGEDDLVMENEIKIKILKKIKELNIEHINLCRKLINLFEYSIKHDRWIHFAFT